MLNKKIILKIGGIMGFCLVAGLVLSALGASIQIIVVAFILVLIASYYWINYVDKKGGK